MTNYLKKADFDQSKFYKVPKTMWIDDRIMEDTRGNHFAVRLYMGVGDKVKLSERKHTKENDSSFVDLKGKYFCTLPVKTAREELGLKRGKYNDAKAFLKEIGLIHFEEQEEKKEGVASRIYITPWEVWVKQNGLYSDGEWIVQPSSENFYNPKDIVTVQPSLEEAKEIEQVQQEPTEEEINEYESIMDKAKRLGIEFKNSNRMLDLKGIVHKHFGKGKLLKNATVEDLPLLREVYKEMDDVFTYGDNPDF